jgi:DNA-binding winged helix-turn-helix (wHTH) protein/tetratricopeptide (TPR) repeat protein
VTDSTEIVFDKWVLKPSSGELLREGSVVQRLPQQPLRVLVELVEHAGEVVSRERLQQILWPKGVVDFDNSLNAVVRKLRIALKDDSETPRYIETLPRIGYRFVGTLERCTNKSTDLSAGQSSIQSTSQPISSVAVEQPPRRSTRRWVLLTIGACVFVAAIAWAVFDFGWHSSPTSVPKVSGEEDIARKTNQRAYELYLNGKYNRSRRDTNGNPLAIENFQAALREDPYFAEAWAALAETYIGMGIQQHMPFTAAIEQARTAALRAIELNPKLASGHTALGTILLQYDFDFVAAEKQLLKAREMDDRYARFWHSYGLLRGYQGRTDDAFKALGRARELEPTALLYSASYASALYQTRHYKEAIDYVRPLLISQPHFDQVRGVLIRALVETGDIDGALEQLPLRFSDVPLLSDAGLVYARAGRRDDALRQIDRLKRRASEGYSMSYELSIIYAALGDFQEACKTLKSALEDHSPTLGWLRLDPRMDPLRQQPCYADVAKRLYKG